MLNGNSSSLTIIGEISPTFEEISFIPYLDNLNPKSLDVLYDCKIDSDLALAKPGDSFQFMRNGYFTVDKYSLPAGYFALKVLY